VFELWSSESSGPGTSAHHGQTLIAMAEPKPLTYDEQKAAEAAFTGAPANPDWTEAAQLLYARLSAAIQARSKDTVGAAAGAGSGKASGL
jgi:hypothetical protein